MNLTRKKNTLRCSNYNCVRCDFEARNGESLETSCGVQALMSDFALANFCSWCSSLSSIDKSYFFQLFATAYLLAICVQVSFADNLTRVWSTAAITVRTSVSESLPYNEDSLLSPSLLMILASSCSSWRVSSLGAAAACHLESSGCTLGHEQAKSYVLVCTSTYKYVLVHVSTGIYFSTYCYVHTSMY